MGHTYSSLFYHFVWSTKDRAPIIKEYFQQRLYLYMGGIIRNENANLLSIGGMSDHVLLLIKTGTNHKIGSLIQKIKGSSSTFINQKYPSEKFAWQSGYGVFAASVSTLKIVHNYISNQEIHHKKISFEEEFRLLLDKHEIEYNKDFLFQ
ncbi:MAG: IS200/IS605 family transposase [bacterium]